MPYKWMFIIGLTIGALLICCTMKCLEWTDNQPDRMTAYEYILKHPTAAGKR